jgi:hypothetical protein
MLGEEFRLAWLLLLNAAVLASAWLAARRWTTDPVARLLDAMLLWCTVQYAAVCIPGVLHVLSPGTMTLTALIAAAALVFFAGRKTASAILASQCTVLDAQSFWVFLAAGFFTFFLAGCVAYEHAYWPLIDSDAMTYHAPAAVQWLQTGRLSLLPVWFFNPANTFSPLAGSTFFYWWIGPVRSDVLARGVQLPALILLFLATLQLGRAVKLPPIVAALVAAAVAVARPFNSELMSGRDDVYLAAFIAVAVAGCAENALRDRFAPWRIGLAVGLAAATKYTFLFAAPILLLVIDAPIKAGWTKRQWATAILTALALAAPWYLRNWLLTGNPLYPVDVSLFGHHLFQGLFTALRSDRLRTWKGLNEALVKGFHAPPPKLLVVLLIGWVVAVVGLTRQARRNPLIRVCLFGLPLCLLMFLARSPYGEVRFLFPGLAPLFVAVGLGVCRWVRWPFIRYGAGAVFLLIALGTSYEATSVVIDIAGTTAILTAIVLGLIWCDRQSGPNRFRIRAYTAAAALVIAGMFTYVNWHGYLIRYRETRLLSWQQFYPDSANAWQYVSEHVPPDATIAYTNTYTIYPLYGDLLSRKLFHVPLRRDVPDFMHLPRVPAPLPGERIEATYTRLLQANPDAELWLRRLLESRAEFLFVARKGPEGDAPEMAFVERDAAHFTPLFREEGAAIFKINR